MDRYWVLSLTLLVIWLVGIVACLPFYGWNVRKLIRSQLFIKIAMWVPIFALFSLIVDMPYYVGILVALYILARGFGEYLDNAMHVTSRSALQYMCFFAVAALAMAGVFFVAKDGFQNYVVTIAICSVLSDVVAFFSGKFVGKHKLPEWINDRKSWEGVAGQLVGGALGVVIVMLTYTHAATLLFGLAVGAASAVGDIANSVAKRSLGIKDWSQSIPGHGGYLDRFSSLSTAFLFGFAFILLQYT